MYKKGAVLLVLLLSVHAYAGFNGSAAGYGSGGFSGPAAGAVSTAEINGYTWMQDDKPVVLEGKIVRSLGGKHYVFSDAKGETMVEIDNDEWRGIQVTPQNRLRLYGTVDKEMAEQSSVDVDRIEILR
ncbi:NirD/YgiW/YdeI family stress tolerance protein [Edwardsiella piscicida]|uniref:NirD/YgiW/YdeI family stress tolerance protein n=1 Tax=Edwardsiella piscicida TaxID=1263550 RepID=UPI004042D19B